MRREIINPLRVDGEIRFVGCLVSTLNLIPSLSVGTIRHSAFRILVYTLHSSVYLMKVTKECELQLRYSGIGDMSRVGVALLNAAACYK